MQINSARSRKASFVRWDAGARSFFRRSRTKTGRQSRPARWSVLHIVIDSLDLGFGEDREAVRDQVDRVAGLAFDLVARLADAPGDADKIADCGVGEPVAQFAEQGDAVPLRIGLPCFAFAAIVIGGNRDVGDVLGGVDPAEPSDDVEFDDVLHGLSPDRVPGEMS